MSESSSEKFVIESESKLRVGDEVYENFVKTNIRIIEVKLFSTEVTYFALF